MFYGYHITINRKTSDTDAAYKIFFIILELISDYQLSSLFQIIILLKKSTRRGAFFHVYKERCRMEEKVYEYLKRLVSVPGISDTDEERKTAEAIREILAERPYFRAYPENFGTVEIPGDARKRPLVYGLVRGNRKSGRTIILTGHAGWMEMYCFCRFRMRSLIPSACAAQLDFLRIFGSGKSFPTTF